MKKKIFTDTIHGFRAETPSKMMAWALIRNECHELGLQVPTLDKIVELSSSDQEDKPSVATGSQ